MLSVSTAQNSSSWTPAQADIATLVYSHTFISLHCCAVASVAITLHSQKMWVSHSGMSY